MGTCMKQSKAFANGQIEVTSAAKVGRLQLVNPARKNAVTAAMWRAIPLLRPFGLAARNRTVLGLLERLYRVFLRVRPALTRRLGR